MSQGLLRRLCHAFNRHILPLAIFIGVGPLIAGSQPVEVSDTAGPAADRTRTEIVADAPAAVPTTNPILTRLRGNSKLVTADSVLAELSEGKPETAVIVTLQPSAAAEALLAQSQLSPGKPDEFKAPGAPAYYDLQDPTIKRLLRETVTVEVNRVIAELATPEINVTRRFSYQFGFAARVSADALAAIVAHPMVVRVEKDWELLPHLRQGIPLMNAALPRSSHNGGGVSIAVCDSGIDTSHPMLGNGGNPFNAKVIGGYDTGDNDPDPRPNTVAHGTACAGIAAGDLGSTGDYIGGVAPGATLYAVKITTGPGTLAYASAMIAGWEWAVTHQNDSAADPILIISTSYGAGSYSSACDSALPAMTTAAANAVAAGITIFASSGNDGYCNSIQWPACISYVNSVGAVYDADIGQYNPCVSSASCAPAKQPTLGCSTGWYVPESTAADMVAAYSNSAPFLTLLAPANAAYTTDIVGPAGYNPGDYYPNFGGTSAACPYAAGAAAVLQSAAKAKSGAFLSPAQVRGYLTGFGDPVTDGKVAVTKPRINLEQAVNALSAPGTPATPSNLIAAAISDSRIKLSWTDNSDNELGFRVERKTGPSGTWSEIGTAGANLTGYVDTGLPALTTFHYRVRAYNANGNSGRSNEVGAVTATAGWQNLASFGWVYTFGDGNYWSPTYGWLWTADGHWAWSRNLNCWLWGDGISATVWSSFQWFTPSGRNDGWGNTSTLGSIWCGADNGGWVWSTRFEWVVPSGDAHWFWSSTHGWLWAAGDNKQSVWSERLQRWL